MLYFPPPSPSLKLSNVNHYSESLQPVMCSSCKTVPRARTTFQYNHETNAIYNRKWYRPHLCRQLLILYILFSNKQDKLTPWNNSRENIFHPTSIPYRWHYMSLIIWGPLKECNDVLTMVSNLYKSLSERCNDYKCSVYQISRDKSSELSIDCVFW